MQLKNISIDLQQFMKHSVSHLTHFSPNILSHVSVSFLSTLFHKIHNAYIKWTQHQNQIKTKTKTNWLYTPSLSEYQYIPELIRKNIENVKRETIYQQQYTLEIGDKTFHIMIWFPTYIRTNNKSTILMSDIQIQEKVNRILQKIYMWLTIATSFIHKNTKCSKTVNVFLFLTDHKKYLPMINEHTISQTNVNTAFTTGCVQEHTNIYIYREEEWFKVFMHETMHNLGLDFIDIYHHGIDDIIHRTIPITSVQDIRLYETYAETWANIMNILFVVYFTDTPSKKGRLPIVRWTQLFTKRLYLEQVFSLFQATKILYFHKMNYSDFFVVEKARFYKENTQVFSYYILKSVWLLNINSFLEFCVSQKGGASLKFHLSSFNLNKYVAILMKNVQSSSYMHTIKDMYQYYSDKIIQGKEKEKEIPFAKNTLRMTLQELN